MEILAEVERQYGDRVAIHLFGVESADPLFLVLHRAFRWTNHGVQTPQQMASFLSTQDIFVDLSEFQAMGLTAMEAMASGLGVVVPERGGVRSFARHRENAMFVDTSKPVACLEAIKALIEDRELLTRIRRQAVNDLAEYYPERAAFNILNAIFAGN